MFGRNEGGGQRFHRLLDALLETEDQDVERFLRMHANDNGA
jgi:hypothetical protein